MSSHDASSQSAGAYVVKENAQWVVYVTVVYPDHVEEHRIASYYGEKQARTAARYMGFAANRKLPAPDVQYGKRED